MANGTIAFDTLQTSGQITGTAKSVDTDYVVNGSLKSWLNFNGVGTVAVRDSFNLSSLLDVTQGNYTVTMASAMGNVDYTCVGGAASTNAGSGPRYAQFGCNHDSGTLDANFTTTSYSVNVFFPAGTAEYDTEYTFNQVCGDLA